MPEVPFAAPAATPQPASGQNSATKPPARVGAPVSPATANATSQPAAGEASASSTEGAASEVAKAARKLKLKMQGKEVEWPEDRVIAAAQRSGEADRRFHEAAQIKRERDAERELLKRDPLAFLKANGHDRASILRMSESQIVEEMKRAEMSPEQLRIQELERDNLRFQEEQRGAREKEQQAAATHQEQQLQEEYASNFFAALEKAGIKADPGDPLADWAIREMAAAEMANAEGEFGATPDELAEGLHEKLGKGASLMVRQVQGPALLELLESWEPGLVKRINQATLDRHGLTRPHHSQAQPRQPNGSFDRQEERKWISKEEWNKPLVP